MSADPPPAPASGDSAGAPERRPGFIGRLGGHWLVWLFAAVGLIGILCIIAIAAMVLSFEGHRDVAKVAGAKQDTVFAVGTPEELPGTNLLHLPVYASQADRVGSGPYSGSRDDQRNLLLIDKETGASRRILPTNERRIVSAHFLPAKAQAGASNRDDPLAGAATDGAQAKDGPAAYYLLVLDQGGPSQAQQILVGALAGGRQGIVMQGIDGVDSIWMKGPTQIGLIVRERLGLYYRIVDIPSLKVVQSRRLEIDR